MNVSIDFSPPTEPIPIEVQCPPAGSEYDAMHYRERVVRLLAMYERETTRAALMAATYRRAVALLYEWSDGVHRGPRETGVMVNVFGILNAQADGLEVYVGELIAEMFEAARAAGQGYQIAAELVSRKFKLANARSEV